MDIKYKYLFLCIMVIALGILNFESIATQNKPMSEQELEKWFNSNEDTPDPLKLINEGELVFLNNKPEQDPHHAKHIITILPGSLKDGWVILAQCHNNLDVTPAAQVIFQNKRVRDLKVTSSTNIKKAWVENDTVQLEKIGKGATLCLELQTKALWKNKDHSYSLRTGPYQRRFLDGYFPMDLHVDINYPDYILAYKNIAPEIQPGLSVTHNADSIKVNALFKGKLHLSVNFSKK